jgi:N-acyl-D-amino-acid deacylase
MAALVDAAMKEGAVGFSTGLIYIPGTYSNTDEVVALAKAAARHDGVYASHMRDEGEKVMEAIEEAVRVGKEAGMRVELSHFKIDNKRLWGASEKSLALVERFRREGVDVVVDQYPYDRSSTNLGITLPSWALADGEAAIKERLKSAETRARIAREMEEKLKEKGHADYSYATVATFKPDSSYEGKTISEINVLKGRGKTVGNEIQTVLDLIEQGGAQMVYHSMGTEDVERILKYPNTAIASDGGVREFGAGVPHPRSYGTNARVLAEYVRRRQVITLEDAIRRMTSLPARTFAFRDRGLIKEGMAADLVIFDPERVEDKATFQKPHQYTEGIDWVLVNGVVMVEDGKLTAARGGRVLRHSAAPRVRQSPPSPNARAVGGADGMRNGRVAALTVTSEDPRGPLHGGRGSAVVAEPRASASGGRARCNAHFCDLVEGGLDGTSRTNSDAFVRGGATTAVTGNGGHPVCREGLMAAARPRPAIRPKDGVTQ